MREIRQADYNPDELAWEVIEEIAQRVSRANYPSGVYVRTLEKDRELFRRVADGDDTNATRDEWLSVEEDWRRVGLEYRIEVYDDGYVGYTYVGTTEEIQEFLDKREEEV